MNKKLSYIILTLLCVFSSTKSYSQREIHPLEPMFTYDYALKYYGNIRAIKKSRIHKAPQYKALENFTAPKGVSSIEHYVPTQDAYFNCESYRPNETLLHPVKTCYYDIETGFLTKEVYKSTDEEGKVKEAVYTYNYKFEEESTTIKVPHLLLIYVFDNKTGNLIELIDESIKGYNISLHFSYSDTIEHQIIEIKYKENDNIKVHKFENGKEIIPEPKPTNPFDPVYLLDETAVSFNDYLISYKYEDYGATNTIEGRFVFDKKQRLIELQRSQVQRHGVFDHGRDYNITTKKRNSNKWIHYRNIEKDYHTYKKKKKGHFKIRNNSIYYNNIPIIIYNYN